MMDQTMGKVTTAGQATGGNSVSAPAARRAPTRPQLMAGGLPLPRVSEGQPHLASRKPCRRFVALLLGLLAIVTVLAPRGRAAAPLTHSAATPHRQVIVAIGDSITQGLHDTQQRGGWVGRLGGQLAHDYPAIPFQLVNKGVNGDTSAGVLARLARDVLALKPALVVVSIGTNDFDYGVPVAAFRYTLTRVVKRIQAAGVPVLTVSMLPNAGQTAARLAAQSAYNASISQVARATGAGYLDEFDQWLALGTAELTRLRADVEHPNPVGYALLASTVAAFVESQYLTEGGKMTVPARRPTSDLLPDAML